VREVIRNKVSGKNDIAEFQMRPADIVSCFCIGMDNKKRSLAYGVAALTYKKIPAALKNENDFPEFPAETCVCVELAAAVFGYTYGEREFIGVKPVPRIKFCGSGIF
jgi:hypothetical protein